MKKYRITVSITDDTTDEVIVKSSMPYLNDESVVTLGAIVGRQFETEIKREADLIPE
jgi:hypothetical protein